MLSRLENGCIHSDHSRIWSQPGKAVPGSHLPTGHIGQLNRAQSKASAGPMYSKFRTPSPSEHSHVVPKHQLRRYPPPPPPPKKKNFLFNKIKKEIKKRLTSKAEQKGYKRTKNRHGRKKNNNRSKNKEKD